MTKKSLQSWFAEGHFTHEQKSAISAINELGIDNYSPEYTLWDLEKIEIIFWKKIGQKECFG